MKYSVFVAPRLRLFQQEAEDPQKSEDAHPAALSAQLLSPDVTRSSLLLASFIYETLLLPPSRGGNILGFTQVLQVN